MVEPLGILKSSSRLSFQTPVGKSRRFVSTGRWCPLSRVHLTRQLHLSQFRSQEVGEDHTLTLHLCALEREKRTGKDVGNNERKEAMRVRKGNVGVEGGSGQLGGPPPFP